MNINYVKSAFCFHGQPMQKIWENERDDMQQLSLPAQPNYAIYQQRQRFFTFQDRAKRLKLHQFLARKASDLYDVELQKYANVIEGNVLEKVRKFFVTMPPFEMLAYDPNDKERKWHAVLESLKPGDIVYGIIGKIVNYGVLPVKPLCTAEPLQRYLNHLPIKGIVMSQDMGAPPLDEQGNIRGYQANDIVCCEVLKISTEVDRIFLSFDNILSKNIELGLKKLDDLPLYYSKAKNFDNSQKYDDFLRDQKEFLNPNYEVLYSINGLDINDTFTMMGSLKQPFPDHEYAKDLRKTQAHKWAFRSVADGIELFKNGHHLEAFQCLNKALNIDPHNVEGLVARGALFANRGSFHKAVDDFGTALSLDKHHANARKYMGETLVALGRSLEDEKRFDEATKAYKNCLELIPHHPQAQGCLDALNLRMIGNVLDDSFFINFLKLPNKTGGADGGDVAATQKITNVQQQQQNKPVATLEILSSSEDGSSDSDSSSESESEQKQAAKSKKESSLSPLSQRMALHAASMRENSGMLPTTLTKGVAVANAELPPSSLKMQDINVRFDQPFYLNTSAQPSAKPTTKIPDANDFQLDDDDTQTRVLKLLKQASAHKKEKKKKTKKSKKSKKNKIKHDELDIPNIEQSLFHTNYLLETYKNIGNANFEQKLNKDINTYEQKIADIQNRQALLRQSLTSNKEAKEESPPPPPSMKMKNFPAFANKIQYNIPAKNNLSNQVNSNYQFPSTSAAAINATTANAAAAAAAADANRFSFQIKRPVKVDIMGLVRIATPLQQRSRSRSISRGNRGHDHNSRSHSRSPDRYRRRRSRSRSSSYQRHNRFKSRSRRSRSRSKHSSSYTRRRSNSRPRSRDSRSRYRRSPVVKISHLQTSPPRNHGNRVWQRPGYNPPPSANDRIWKHDKFEEINSDRPSNVERSKDDEGPSIEEIDEIIKQAQKDRKEQIIKSDKNILKRSTNGRF